MMAALPYMQFYVADYLADTTHLTAEEHGAYMLLLFSYWQTGKPLRIDRLATVARIPNDRWPSVAETLSEFFHVTATHWVQFRVEADLEAVNSKTVKASNAGKASARARALKKQQETNDRSTTVEGKLQHESNHIDTDTEEHNTPHATAEGSAEPVDPKAPSEMTLEWVPDQKLLKAYAARMGIPVDRFTDEATAAFVCHYSASGRFETQASWVSLLVKWVKRDEASASNVRQFPVKRQANGPDFNDTSWADDLGAL
jgi:uncharacterized protein YdaU (DUF1376 family)